MFATFTDWSMDNPHTGVMGYDENYDKIPTAALTMEDAMMLGRIHERGQKITLKKFQINN